jgi:ankyrin repeat protein
MGHVFVCTLTSSTTIKRDNNNYNFQLFKYKSEQKLKIVIAIVIHQIITKMGSSKSKSTNTVSIEQQYTNTVSIEQQYINIFLTNCKGTSLARINFIKNNIEAMHLLIDTANKYGNTPLHYASEDGHTDVVKLLLEHNANIDTANKCGKQAIHYASKYGHTDVVKLLLEHNCQY